MAYILIIVGAILVYFGINKKVSDDKTFDKMTGNDLFKTGCRGYFKMMMIAGGIILILFGLFSLLF